MTSKTQHKDVEDYESLMSQNNTDGTVYHYGMHVRRFEDWRARNHLPAVLDTVRDYDAFLRDGKALREFKNEVRDEDTPWNKARPPRHGYSYRSRIQAISAAKSWLEFRREEDYPKNRQTNVHYICQGDYPVFDPEIASSQKIAEIFDLTKRCKADACHAMTVVGFDCIMRCVEVVNLKWDDYKNGRLFVNGAKGGNSTWIQLSPRADKVLNDYRDLVKQRFDDPQWMFYRFSNDWMWNKKWSAAAWSRHFRGCHWGPGFHAFARHTPITIRLGDGEPLDKVSARARHVNPDMTMQYLNLIKNDGYVPEVLK